MINLEEDNNFLIFQWKKKRPGYLSGIDNGLVQRNKNIKESKKVLEKNIIMKNMN